jgi:hypothetical protein
VLVAFFPTGAPDGFPVAPWWTPWTGGIHYVSAVVLFSTFAFYCLYLFPKSQVKKGGRLPLEKRVRNKIYRVCGLVIVACMLWAGSSWFTGASIFWAEALALNSFAVSWLVKGRFDRTLVAAGTNALYYGRRPEELIGELRNALGR